MSPRPRASDVMSWPWPRHAPRRSPLPRAREDDEAEGQARLLDVRHDIGQVFIGPRLAVQIPDRGIARLDPQADAMQVMFLEPAERP